MFRIKSPLKTALVISNHPPDSSPHTFTVTVGYGIPPCPEDISYPALKFIRGIAGKIGDHTMGICKVEYFKNRIVRSLVLPFDNRVVHAAFLDGHVVLKHGLARQANPRILRGRNRHLNLRVCL